VFQIGCHISSSGGYAAMANHAFVLGANTFAFFTRNPRGGSAKRIDDEDIKKFYDLCNMYQIDSFVAHAPYTLNACALKPNVLEFAYEVFQDDLKRMEKTPGQYYNFHPGSHVGQGVDVGIEKIADMLNRVLWPEMSTTVLLETMAGKGSEIGSTFEELRKIIDQVELKDKLGICLDTCHIWDAGYDIENNLECVIENFDEVIGLDRLKVIHLNNSMNACGSKKDRHARITEGKINIETFAHLIRHSYLKNIPFILETPNDEKGYAEEIALLKNML